MNGVGVTMARGAKWKPNNPANFITYAIAACVTFVGLCILLYIFILSAVSAKFWMFAVSVFIMFVVFVIGAVKFFCSPSSRVGEVADKLVHCEKTVLTFAIAFAVVMPILLNSSSLVTKTDKIFGSAILSVIGCATIADIVINLLDISERKLIELALYVVISWACVIRLNRIAELSRYVCVYLFIVGFAVYLIGAVVGSISAIKCRRLLNSFAVVIAGAINLVGIFFYA